MPPLKQEYCAEGYLAPEAALNNNPTYMWDWYAAGQVLLKLLERCSADGDSRELAQIREIAHAMCIFICTTCSIYA